MKSHILFILISVLASLIVELNSFGHYTLALVSQERGAACLDGSSAGLYYHLGSGTNKNKYLIYFNGGGFCEGKTVA